LEIPIFHKLLSERIHLNETILEVGNVLSNYFTVNHEIIDKYDKHDFVNKSDIIEFSPNKKYDIIFCISTLEHIGWDEEPKQPEKILIALSKLKALLKDNGSVFISIPMGENPVLDEYLKTGKILFDQQYNFLRIGKRKWMEVTWDKIKNAKSNTPFRFANAMVLGIIKK